MHITPEEFIQRCSAFGTEPYGWETRKPYLSLVFPMEEYELRLEKVRKAMEAEGLDYMLFFGSGANKGSIEWLKGFPASEGDAIAIVPKKGDVMLTSNGIYHCSPMHSLIHRTWVKDFRPAHMPGAFRPAVKLMDYVQDYIREHNVQHVRIGIENGDIMSHAMWEELQHVLRENELAEADIGLRIRAIKSPREIAWIEQACRVSDKGLMTAIVAARPGMRECDLAALIYAAMADGSDYFFHMMISSGEACGLKHDYPSSRRMEDGDMIYVDLGISAYGYITDTSRTWCVGHTGEFEHRLLDCGLEMYQAVVEKAKPGITPHQLQQAAFAVAGKHNLQEYFWPILGHGIGTEISEMPHLGWGNQTPLQAGNVFALEPMVTKLGVGCGVIEDVILITENGCRALTDAPRKLW